MNSPGSRWASLGGELGLVGWVLLVAGLWPVGRWLSGGHSGTQAHFCIEARTDTDSVAQLFYDSGAGFSEAQSDSVFIKRGRLNRLAFSVSARAIRAIRFDPLTSGGTVEITRVWCEDATGARVRDLPLKGFEPAHQIAALRDMDTRVVVTMPDGADDPQLTRSWATPLMLPNPPPPWTGLGLAVAGVALVIGGGRGRRLPAISGAAATTVGVAFVAGAFLWPLHRTLDYPLWDETNYFGWGRAFLRTGSLREITGSPGYHAWYAAWCGLLDGCSPIFASHYGLKIGVVGLALLVARRWFGSWFGAGVVAVSVAIAPWQLTFPILVYHAAFAWFLAALAVADRSRIAALGFLALAALTRLEYFFALLLTLLLWWIVRRGISKTDRDSPTEPRPALFRGWALTAWLPLLLAIYMAGHVQGWAFGGERGWFAFQQHYAVGVVEARQVSGVNPWMDYPAIVQRDFPGAHSLADAFHINASAVLHHLGRNLAAVPARLEDFLRTPYPGRAGAVMAGVLGLLAFGSAAIFSAGDFPRLRGWLRSRRWSLAIAGSGLAAIAPGLVVYATTAYLLPLIPLLWCLLATAAAWWRGRHPSWASHRKPQAAAVALVVLMAVVVQGAPRPLAVLQPQPVRENLEIIRAACPSPVKLLGLTASSYAIYLGPDYSGVEPLESVAGQSGAAPQSLASMIARERPDAVLITGMWRALASFDPKAGDDLAKQGWRKIPLVDGDLYLARAPSP